MSGTDPPRLVLFDLDGTLADTFPWFSEAINGAARRYGFRQVAPGERETLRGLSAREVMRSLAIPAWKVPLVAAHLRRRMTREIDAIHLFPGVDAILAELHESGTALGLVSSNSAANVHQLLGAANSSLLRFLECGAAIHGKPARLARLLCRAGMAAAEAVYVGDEIRDILAARTLGMRAGAVTWGYNSPEALRAQAPDFLFEHIDDIPRALLRGHQISHRAPEPCPS